MKNYILSLCHQWQCTKTKPDAVPVSMEELKKTRRAVDLPIVVIGGINGENAEFSAPMGINGLAVISAVIAQPYIKQAAALMMKCYKGGGPKTQFDASVN